MKVKDCLLLFVYWLSTVYIAINGKTGENISKGRKCECKDSWWGWIQSHPRHHKQRELSQTFTIHELKPTVTYMKIGLIHLLFSVVPDKNSICQLKWWQTKGLLKVLNIFQGNTLISDPWVRPWHCGWISWLMTKSCDISPKEAPQ